MNNKTANSADSQAQVGGFYGILTEDVELNENLSWFEKVLFTRIAALTNRDGYCWATNAYFAERYSTKNKKKLKESISRSISNLVKEGFLDIELIKNDKEEIVERRLYVNTLSCKSPRNTSNNTCTLLTGADKGGINMGVKGGIVENVNRGINVDVNYNNTGINNRNNIYLNVETGSQRTKAQNDEKELIKQFEEDIWNKRLCNEGMKGSKKVAFKKWKIAIKQSGRETVKNGWESYVAYQQFKDWTVKRPEFFLTAEKELWMSDWSFEQSRNTGQLNHSAGVGKKGSGIDEIANWKYKLGVAKNRGLLTDSQYQEAKNASAWKYVAREYKEIIIGIEEEPKAKEKLGFTYDWRDFLSRKYGTEVNMPLEYYKNNIPELYNELVEEQERLNNDREYP
jgi:hypothetical protein